MWRPTLALAAHELRPKGSGIRRITRSSCSHQPDNLAILQWTFSAVCRRRRTKTSTCLLSRLVIASWREPSRFPRGPYRTSPPHFWAIGFSHMVSQIRSSPTTDWNPYRRFRRVFAIYWAFDVKRHLHIILKQIYIYIQAERYKQTITARLRHYVSEHQDNWDQCLQPLTYAYNSQVHASTGTTTLNLTITRPPPCPNMDGTSPIVKTDDYNVTLSSRAMRARIVKRLVVMFDDSDSRSPRARARYGIWLTLRFATRISRPSPVIQGMLPCTYSAFIDINQDRARKGRLDCTKMTGSHKVLSSTT